MAMIAEKIRNALFQTVPGHVELDPKKPLILAVSGGVDSLCLAHTLKDAGLNLLVAHLDHALRAVSARQAETLGEMMADWGLPFISQRVDVNAFAKQEKLGIEEAARLCRYRFLFEVARAHDAQAIVLGHNADDQVETVLMHFMRGSGMAGLTGMAPYSILKQFDANVPLIRPMLVISRAEIEAYASRNHLQPLEDESNAQPVYYRNKLRLELIPAMEALNPGFRQSVLRAAEVLRGDNALLQKLEQEALENCLSYQSAHELILDRNAFLALDLALQRRLVRRCLNHLRPVNPDFGFEDIEKARELIRTGTGAVDLSLKARVVMVGNDSHFLHQGKQPSILNWPQFILESNKKLTLGDCVVLNPGWHLRVGLLSAADFARISKEQKEDSHQAFLNPDALKNPLTLRAMRAGERWTPLGLRDGSQKLSDFFVNNKIPQPARAGWPLVLSGEAVIWVVGLRIAHPWRLQGGETQVLHLCLERSI